MLLMLSFVVSMVAVPNANAQTKEKVSWPFVDALPNPAGLGQPVLINWGLLNYLSHVDHGWNVTLQITHPNGRVENITAKTWSTGTVGRKIAFMEPGNYTLQAVYDGEYYAYNNNPAHALSGNYKPAKSTNVTLQVIEGFWKADHPGHTLPDEYWTRPVDSQLREWYSIMGSWLDGSRSTRRYVEFNSGPESAHILWSREIGDTTGGLAGGDSGTIGFQTGDAYEGRFYDAVIVAGVLYYNREFWTSGSATTPLSLQMVVAVDLHTGKTLWERNFNFGNGRINRAQILTFISENNRGTFSYLWIGSSGNMYAIEPKTGELRYNMTGVPTGTFFYGPSGELLKYSIVNYGTTADPKYHLLQWNSTYTVTYRTEGASGGSDAWGSQVHTASSGNIRSFPAANGYDINVSIPGLSGAAKGLTGTTVASVVGSVATAFPDDRVIFSTNPNANGMKITGISLDPENLGYLLFSRQFDAPKEWEEFNYDPFILSYQVCWVSFSQDDMMGIFWTKDNICNYGFSLETGRFIWQSEPRIYADSWSSPKGYIAYGKFITSGVGGIVYCYDVKTGDLLWKYEAKDKYNESYHGENWWVVPVFITDGKAYFGHFVHSNTVPISRGAPFFALDCETGDLLWEIDGAFRQSQWAGQAIIGDSIIVTPDVYDMQLYAVGKGPSEMTVSMSNAIATAGAPVLISGTVMDISPGTQSDDAKFRFSKGVPAVSDESMSEWMLYVYKHFSRPLDATGVEVTVFAQQGNNVIDIGNTTSDANGRFSITWIPPTDATGDYDIYAYFSGSAGYYGSYAKTETAVFAAPEVIEPDPLPPYGWYILGAVIANIAVVLICMFLTYRKIGKTQ